MGAPNTETTSNNRETPQCGTSDGYTMGQTASDYIGFYGATPVKQPTAAAQAAITDTSGGAANSATGVTTITGTYNSTILANAFATVIAAVNAHRTALVNLGLIKGS